MTKENDFTSVGLTMSPPTKLLSRGGAFLRALLLIMCMLFSAQSTWADSGAWYFKEDAGFKWNIAGDCEIEFSIPVFIWDSSSNDAVKWGYLYVTPDGESETELIYYAYDEGDDSRNMDEPVFFQALTEGDFKVTNTTSGTVSFTRNDGKRSWVLKRDADDDDHHTAKIRWKVPYQWRGKTLKFRVKFNYYDKFGNTDVEHSFDSYDCPAAAAVSLALNDPMLAFDKSSAGYIMIPWYAQAKSISNAKLTAVDAATGHASITRVQVNGLTGYVNLPMNRPYSSVSLSGSVVATDGTAVPGELSSSTIAVPMLHTPTNLTASMQPDGKVVLKWNVDLPEYDDIMESDMFDIQRNMTGSTNPDDASWTTITQEQYEPKKGSYEVVDADMINRYQGKPVTYRVRRQATVAWGWVPAAKYAEVQIPANVNIFGVNSATAMRSSEWNDDVHKVDFTFNFGGPETDENGTLIIRTVADWEKLAQRVSAGETGLNVIMAGDIDLGKSQVMIGTEANPYQGTFDGNGYTLTVHYNSAEEWTAPFRYVKGATIKGLSVDGDITTSKKHTAGLIAYSDSATSILSTSVLAAITSSYAPGNDGSCVGGFVSQASKNVGLKVTNCRFAGQLLGENCYANGGFVGHAASVVKFDKCLFEPTKITMMYKECKTYARGVEPELTSCYYKECYDDAETAIVEGYPCMVIRTADDWVKFRDAVAAAGGNDVHAVLANDISIVHSVGLMNDVPYSGYFNGNGHTLNVNIDGASIRHIAPFARVNNAVIRNLHVTGTVKGGMYSSGLVGISRDGLKLGIYNVRVSANIIVSGEGSAGPRTGGFVGYAGNGRTEIVNCLFDGTITAKSWNASYSSAFIGWSNYGGSWGFECNLENGKYVNSKENGMCMAMEKSLIQIGSEIISSPKWWGGSGSNYSVHDWWEMASNANRNVEINNSLVDRLGGKDNWKYEGGLVIPKMAVASIGQGETAVPFTDEELLAKLDTTWVSRGNAVVPTVQRTEGSIYGSAVWDNRAKLQLRINMHGENGVVDSNIIDLSGNEDVIKKNKFTQEISRKCVEYSFDLIVGRGKSPLPIINVKGDTAVYAVKKVDQGDLANYRFQNSDRITSLTANKKQSSVELVWETAGGDHDFFRVLRRLHSLDANAAWTDTIATDLNQLFFEDKTVLVQQAYDYKVESVWQCEGTNIESLTCTGECEPTGMVNGYIRMADGTALGGVTVECRPDNVPGANSLYTTKTDEAGYYEFKGLPFQGTGRYIVTVPVSGDGGNYTGPNDQGSVVFSTNSNWTQNFNFFMDTYYVYSGHVYYRDTSIPVPGVSFKLDGNVMHDASQQVITTDTQGAFSLSIPKGGHSVQAVKDGHVFAEQGFLMNPDALTAEDKYNYNFIKNVSNVYLWDTTYVMLRGRVVGGDVQGSKPLGQSLSENNLGDSIKIVMQLEGDNASYLIRKQDDETVKSASYVYNFGPGEENTARVDVTRHTLTIRPDAKTGEYQVMLRPAKYKVIEISGEGYATLFQQGKVGETVDLSFNVEGDTCEYNRIYHAVPTVEVTQFNPGGEKYFGVKKLTASDNIGNKAQINLWYTEKNKADSTKVDEIYSLGHPVFMAGSPYGFMLQACEKYYKNNNINNVPDIVNLSGGKVKIQNDLTTDSKTAMWEQELDANGGASYIFTPDNTTFTIEGDNALKNVSITLEYDGSYYDVKPFNGKILQGYVMATIAKSQGRKTVVSGTPKLFDILRDPPGGSSSAYIEEGTKLSYGYTWDLTAKLGLSIKQKIGKSTTIYNGVVAAPAGQGTTSGTIQTQDSKTGYNVDIHTNFGMSWTYSYNMDITERIQTSSSKKWIGSKADIFIGTTENVVFEDAMAVRVIPDSMYQIVKQHGGGTFQMTDKDGNTAKIKVPDGTTKVLVKGTDDTGKPIYLVRDEVMRVYPTVKSTFAHTQNFIENELLPDLMKIRNSLLLPMGTDAQYAQALADKQGYPAYVSKVDAKDSNYGLTGYYEPYYPDGVQVPDSISALNQEMYSWISMIAKNERDKISVLPHNLVKRYDFDGAANIQYSETFSTTANGSRYLRYPLLSDFGNVLNMGGAFPNLVKAIEEGMTKGKASTSTDDGKWFADNDGNMVITEIKFAGSTAELAFKPVIMANFNDKFTSSETHSKKTGFTLSASSKSSLTVDVYRTETQFTYDKNKNNFYNLTEEYLDKVRSGSLGTSGLSWVQDTTAVFSNFVFRTVGGVTCEPYEKERVTKWYQPGTVIDVATVPADKPRIWIDEPVVSNVPFDEPARFKLHMANESEYPERASLIFNYYLLASSNPNGAKVLVEGTPINSQGVNIVLYPCRDKQNEVVVFDKEIEVWPGKEFDYNDLTLCLYDPEDANRVFDCKFSAHFIPAAGKVSVSTPGNNWVMNTESPYDGKRQDWYMPVRIDGFDTNYRGFDHIELQYKLSTQGDKDWVNVCSFYKDKELMAKASGVTDTIPDNGVIVAKFYGETGKIEQYYDLRAVNYCRHAGGFLTGSSEILKGIKDTRVPQVFGTPEPTDGILGIGNDIMIKFSEPIAGNYLRGINNFEVLGSLVSNDVSTSTSLGFTGLSVVMTQGSRNLSGKSFTVDVMLNPTADEEKMTVFSHGGEEKGLRFGLTADRKLMATINGQAVESDSIVKFNNALHEVAYALDQSGDNMTIHFFDGSKAIGSKTLSGKYEGASPLKIGFDITGEGMYKGDMLEFRLWNRALAGGDSGDLSLYGKKKLTGYESGLMDYYPMNEGEGVFAYDKAPGSMDLMLAGTSWKRPAGISMAMKGDKGIVMKPDKFQRGKNQDYTLAFWFRTTDKDNTLFSNGEAKRGQAGQINIGIKDYNLYVRSAGFEKRNMLSVAGPTDGNWHHFAMTVSRSQNVANVYLDKKLIDSFAADSLSGIEGDHIALGATYVDKNTPTNAMTGNIDEVGMFSSVLPLNLIKEFSNHTPLGTMSAMMAYLDFGRSEKNDQNIQHLEPTGISLKRYVDSQGKILERRDTLLADTEVDAFADRNVFAPMVSNAQLDNLNYSFVANDNELYVNITEPDFMVEKTNVYVTVKEVPDLQGNLMASPLTMNVYVYRNPLRWDVKRISKEVNYGEGMTFEATVKNLSGVTQNYRLEDLPIWISASQTSGVISALDEATITFTVSPYINIGTYDEQLALVGDNNMSEPLPIQLRVRGCEPDWAVSDRLKQMNQTMMMVARVKIDGVVANSEEDVLAVFDENQQVLGVTNIEVNENGNANEALAFLTIYGYTNPDGSKPTLNFRFFEANTGSVFKVMPADNKVYTFTTDALLGSAADPIVLKDDDDNSIWWLDLKQGWNWVTLPVKPEGKTVGQYLDGMSKWEVGDKILSINGTTKQEYTCRESKKSSRGYKWDKEDEIINIIPSQMYSIYSMSDKKVYLEGEPSYAPIVVHKDWNRIGYVTYINLPISQALSDYTERAQEGDVVKSQDGFAIASRTATGLVWKGTLQYMEAGKGYMLKRLADSEVEFYYPLYFSDNRYSGEDQSMAPRYVNTATTMNIVAAVEGFDTEPGDRLVVFNGAERMAEATADDEQNYYLNIGSDDSSNGSLTFVIERDGETVAMTGSHIKYSPNQVLGTPAAPTAISFTSLDQMPHDGQWDNVGGVLIGKKPTQSGVYIYNGKAVVVK